MSLVCWDEDAKRTEMSASFICDLLTDWLLSAVGQSSGRCVVCVLTIYHCQPGWAVLQQRYV